MSRVVFFTNPWASAQIRGNQIAALLDNAVVNPDSVQEGDICIFVKSYPDAKVAATVAKCYLDVVDSVAALNYAKDEPRVSVIAISTTAHDYVSKYLQRDDIILIPEHHCNFKNELRDRENVTRVGFCGYRDNFHLPFEDVSSALASIGMEFVYETEVEDRLKVCDFYKSIDIQLCFRKIPILRAGLKNPLKLANAGSFRIPTVAYPEMSYVTEWDGAFARVNDLAQIVRTVKVLKESTAAYDNLADSALKKSQEYHIDKIIPLYRSLVA